MVKLGLALGSVMVLSSCIPIPMPAPATPIQTPPNNTTVCHAGATCIYNENGSVSQTLAPNAVAKVPVAAPVVVRECGNDDDDDPYPSEPLVDFFERYGEADRQDILTNLCEDK